MTRINTELRLDDNSNEVIRRVKEPVKGFWGFMNRYSIVSLAIAVIIGQTTKDVVDKLVNGIITPSIQLLLPNVEIQDLVLKTKGAEFKIGEFIDSFIQMLIVMLLIYIVFGLLFKNKEIVGKKSPKSKKAAKK